MTAVSNNYNSALDQAANANPASDATDCFHCGLPVPVGFEARVSIAQQQQPMCCYGCQAVAEAIVAAGHADFYRHRTELSIIGQPLVPEFLRETMLFDSDILQQQFVVDKGGTTKETNLILDGITCAACVWLIEQSLAAIPGVEDVRLNYASERAWLRWRDDRVKLSEILLAVAHIGYRAMPYDPAMQQQKRLQHRQMQQRRLLVGGLFAMQVMMISISLYLGAGTGMEPHHERFFRWLSLALSLPVVLYAAVPFYQGAWRAIKNGLISMDLPVSMAIIMATTSSVIATLRGQGHLYFDSAVMFVFLLTASRYFEMMARERCAINVEKLVQGLPLLANRILPGIQLEMRSSEIIPAKLLQIGDEVMIAAGETVPADGVVSEGASSADESLINGESLPLPKQCGDSLVGGSINLSHPLRMTVSAVGTETLLHQIHCMIERAQSNKPRFSQLADRFAGHFILFVLVVVVATGFWWWSQGSDQWFETALAVLIISCPCALSLATPTAVSMALGNLQAQGLLVRRGAALEILPRVSHIVFDKTGTLTEGKPKLIHTQVQSKVVDHDCLQLAASLENYSEHPLAKAVVAFAGDVTLLPVTGLQQQSGGGISGVIADRRYYIGSTDYVLSHSNQTLASLAETIQTSASETVVVLADDQQLLARYSFLDQPRSDAADLIKALKEKSYAISLMSGDRASATEAVANHCAIDDWHADMSPQMKLDAVTELQVQGACVLMIGDGINDAPVLAAADTSIAMGGASAVARSSADVLLLSNHLRQVLLAIQYASATQRVIRQNMLWALSYNLCAIPAAALGFVSPWMAAIGMSLSSLLVVLNAMRLKR